MPRPPPKKHPVKKAQPLWKPGAPRQVIADANDQVNRAAQTLAVTIPGTTTQKVGHSLGRLPRAAWVTQGSPKVTVTGATTTDITLTNADAAPQTVTVALL